jgi:hypothetical protein
VRITRRHLQIAIGLLWLLDGILQLQPFMFTTGFAHQILAPAADGQPGWVGGPVHLFANHIAQHPALFNSVAAAVQLALGAGFLLRRTVRPAIVASIIWAVTVWWFGEGLGGLASGHATLITGAPGAAALYGLLAAGSWPVPSGGHPDRGAAPARWLPWAWATIWVGGAALQMLPPQTNPRVIAEQIRATSHGAPGWIAASDRAAADVIAHFGTGGLVFAASVMAAIGFGVLIRGRIRIIAGYLGAGLAALFWLVGQNLGELYTGQATDPNSAVLLILLAAAIVSTATTLVTRTTHAPGSAPPTDRPPAQGGQPTWTASPTHGHLALEETAR